MPAGPLFPPLSEENLLLEYITVAREHRRRVLWLFLAVAAAFGLVVWLFFAIPAGEALLVAAGLAVFIFLALPRTRFVYRITEHGVFAAEYYGDAFDLHRVLPPAFALLVFIVIAFSLPLRVLAFTGLGFGAALFLLRRFFPAVRPEISHMAFAETAALAVDPHRRVFALLGRVEPGVPTPRLLVFCNRGELDRTLELARSHLGPVPLRDEPLIH